MQLKKAIGKIGRDVIVYKLQTFFTHACYIPSHGWLRGNPTTKWWYVRGVVYHGDRPPQWNENTEEQDFYVAEETIEVDVS